MEKYHWLRHKSPGHIEKFRASMTDNWHAFKHGKYSKKKHGMTCLNCSLAYYCPYYKSGSFCIIIKNKVEREWKKVCGGG